MSSFNLDHFSNKMTSILTRLNGRRQSGLGSIHAIGELLYGSGLQPWDSAYEIYNREEDWLGWGFHLLIFGLLFFHSFIWSILKCTSIFKAKKISCFRTLPTNNCVNNQSLPTTSKPD
jgi:hypothetical protein